MPMKIVTIKLNHHLDIPTSKGATGKTPLKRVYHKNCTNCDIENKYCNCPKNGTAKCFNAAMEQKDADGMANDSAI